jgi:hypothetical protein
MDDNCIPELCDPDGLPVGQAIRLAKLVSRFEPNLASSLGAYVRHLADSPGSNARLMQRALELLCAVADPRSFAATCRLVADEGNDVAGAMVQWLAAGTPRRLTRRLTATPGQLIPPETRPNPLQPQ